jgi:hypothetical protein
MNVDTADKENLGVELAIRHVKLVKEREAAHAAGEFQEGATTSGRYHRVIR